MVTVLAGSGHRRAADGPCGCLGRGKQGSPVEVSALWSHGWSSVSHRDSTSGQSQGIHAGLSTGLGPSVGTVINGEGWTGATDRALKKLLMRLKLWKMGTGSSHVGARIREFQAQRLT